MLNCLLRVVIFLLANAVWWRWIDRALRAVRYAIIWRVIAGAFVLTQVAYLLLYTAVSLIDSAGEAGPMYWRTEAYIWHLLALPLTLLVVFLWRGCGLLRRLFRRKAREAAESAGPTPAGLTRRRLMAAAGLAVPALASIPVALRAVRSLDRFRALRLEIDVPNLPKDLDGLQILHMTDLHIGRFLPQDTPKRVADAVNKLEADLVVFTGDLIDASCKEIEPGVEFLRSLKPRSGLAIIEGNHDGVWGADWFERGLKDRELPLLLDESMLCRIPGRATPVQFLGVTWGELRHGSGLAVGEERKKRYRTFDKGATKKSLQTLISEREARAFPILLAHHPDIFDEAAGAGLPLTLAGHTHGGQIMFSRNIGAGPVRFRYWTGLYRKGNSRLFVSNGLGS